MEETSRIDEERELQARSRQPRLFQLDALRGIASVIVVLHHYRAAYNDAYPSHWYLVPLFAGPNMVVLFFVLSGYVLSLPYWQGRRVFYARYVLRRVCRIYLPYAAAATLCIGFAWKLGMRHLPLSGWFAGSWQTHVTPALIAEQYAMVPITVFNTAFWSLSYEMGISLVLPFLLWAMERTRPAAFLAAAALICFVRPNLLSRLSHIGGLPMTLQITTLFLLGACLAYYREPLARTWSRLGASVWVLFACSLGLLVWIKPYAHNPSLAERWMAPAAAGAAGVIWCSLHSTRLTRILTKSWLEYLGRVSYSLYLTHALCLYALLTLLLRTLPRAPLGLLIVSCTFLVAHLFLRLVEEPSIQLGKRVTASAPRAKVDAHASTTLSTAD